ncbi:SRPBCC family protein [Sphingosinicella rhizophila]|uniref:Polyketide cyclase/dehydrase/lipid transport protein n=1 Tax=Sphingosinicella rhizophila TaxID=3050082 RepID=A0ABU3Q5S6_9SPHN|nr:hypothetical protein [Sphingosinicella sp. GR2756]MDT9598758.1 hypothetical protein [Sphingosinicella sp. GR2756]
MSRAITATIVNHVAIDIDAPAEAVWDVIIEQFVDAKGFRSIGTVTDLDDLSAPLGGYHIRLDLADDGPDERVARITERNDAARRLSLFADYLSVPGGMCVYATYHAQEVPGGARFALDCHTSVQLDLPADASRADVAATIEERTASYDEALAERLEKMKARLETQTMEEKS